MLKKQPPRPLCANCRVNLSKPNGKSKKGFTKWHKYCAPCSKQLYNPRFSHLKNKKLKCEGCGFVPQDMCQLDLIFKDGNRKNRELKNLKTLCANCSRLWRKKNKKKTILDLTVDSDLRIG